MKTLPPIFKKRWQLPKADLANRAIRSFTITEKLIFWFFAVLFIFTGLLLLWKVNTSFMVEVPDHGGELVEGIIGSPRFVNPLLAMGDADKDVTSLVYSGLMKVSPDGDLIPDLAKSYDISSDGLTYTFTLKDNVKFQDGTAVSVDDVVFTIQKAQDPALKSPKRGSWDGITIQKINDKEVSLTLKQPYGPFLQNTTLGILPKHIWQDASSDQFSFSQYNIQPIGSGPYRVTSIARNSAGIPIGYTLKSFANYAQGEPYIDTLTLKFYPDEAGLLDAYDKGNIESGYGFSAATISELESRGVSVKKSILPRIFAVFFNQSQAPVFANKEVRIALDTALDKDRIVKEVLHGYGTAIDGPIPPLMATTSIDTKSEDERFALASAILKKAGWTKNATSSGVWIKKDKKTTQTMSFSIATGDAPELKAAAQKITDDWNKFGAKVDLQVYETGDLNQNIIRPRKYDALFFGEIVGRDLDFFPFWHSSQRNDPGLNIALYVNSKVDKILESARAISDAKDRNAKYADFANIIATDQPVVFTYAPSFLYVLSEKVQGVKIGQLTTPGERFANIEKWYVETNRIWNIFLPAKTFNE
jgi:peptide/nickel transport system substrate-binding protein